MHFEEEMANLFLFKKDGFWNESLNKVLKNTEVIIKMLNIKSTTSAKHYSLNKLKKLNMNSIYGYIHSCEQLGTKYMKY